jgi:hypothetical protein
MILKGGWAVMLIALSGCAERAIHFDAEEDLYAAALVHLDTALQLDAQPIVHPAMMSVQAGTGEPLGWDRGEMYVAHPAGAIRAAVLRRPGYDVCSLASDGSCVIDPGEVMVAFSRIDWSEGDHPHLYALVVERFPATFGARTFRVDLSRNAAGWTVSRFDLAAVEN